MAVSPTTPNGSITKALGKLGPCKFLFALKENNGRINKLGIYMIKKFSEALEGNVSIGLIVNQIPDYSYNEYTDEICPKTIDILEKHCGEKITIAAYALIKHQKRGDLAVVANQMTGVLGKITPQEIALIDEVKASEQDLKEYNGHY